jgi:hypothetical protein
MIHNRQRDEQYRIVTPEQFRDGYKIYHKGQVPNVTSHPFISIRKLPNGNYVVEEPKTT